MIAAAFDGRPIRVFLRGSPSLRDNLLSTDYGGESLTRGIVETVYTRFPDHSLEVVFEECQGAASLRRALTASALDTETGIRDFEPDLVVLSVDADLLTSSRSWGDGLTQAFESNMLEAIRVIKNELGCRVIMFNASSVVPNEAVSNYRMVDKQPHVLDAHRLNLATMRLSLDEGISIVDVDRVIAELGGAEHVRGFLDYSLEARQAICLEFVRVVEDYGFFDIRPLLPQVGRRSTNH